MERFDVLIVGAGWAGSVCAERLASAGKSVLVIDQRDHIGGNAYDEYDAHGILVSRYGAHIWHTNSPEVHAYVSRFTEWRPYEHRVLASVHGRLLPVPINQTTLDWFDGDEAAAKRVLYEPYTAKQWGPYAAHLAPTVLARVTPRAGTDDRYFTDTYQAMPTQGYTKLFQRMLAHPNIKILLKTNWRDVEAMLPLDPETERFNGQIVWTGPIDEFFDYRFGRLPYRSARFEYETLAVERYQRTAVVNYPSADVGFTRVTEFKQLTGQVHQQTTLAYEYPCAKGEPFWPVPTAESAALYKQYEEHARTVPNVHFLGRLGTFQYYDQHQVVAQALKFTAQLLQKEDQCRVA